MREPIEERGLQFQSIASYETVVAIPAKNPLAKKSVIRLRELKPMFFIGMSEQSYPGYRRWLTQTCRKVALGPQVLHDACLERTVLPAVTAGAGVALECRGSSGAWNGGGIARTGGVGGTPVGANAVTRGIRHVNGRAISGGSSWR